MQMVPLAAVLSVVPGPAASASPGKLLEMHILGSPPQMYRSRNPGGRTQKSVLSQALHVILVHT